MGKWFLEIVYEVSREAPDLSITLCNHMHMVYLPLTVYIVKLVIMHVRIGFNYNYYVHNV